MMKPTLVLLTAALFTTSGWTAEDVPPSRHESIGIGSGAAIGGLAGGPVGVVLGAALGGWVGEQFDTQRTARVAFEQRWTEARAEIEALNGLVTSSERHVAALQTELQATREMHTSMRDVLDVQVLFRTNESTLPEATETRLLRLAALLARLDGTLIRIEGHADSRGDPVYNERLSAQRAATVRDVLLSAGVPVTRIMTAAHGEAHALAAENDVDALAMERRVDLTLIRNGNEHRMVQQ